MKFIEEIIVEEFIPTVRSMLAERLHESGLTQHEVAMAIGVSQSSVSKYVHGDVQRNPAILDHSEVNATVDTLAEGLSHGDIRPLGALIELEILIRTLEAPGEILAELHEMAVPALREVEEPFRVHDPSNPVRDRERIRRSVRRALRELEREPTFVEMIPQVGSNLVECLPSANSIEDVAGVPGRLFPVDGELAIPGDPGFGQSQHVAEVLLAARDAGHPARSAINIAFTPGIVHRLSAAGHDVVEVDGDADLPGSVRSVLTETPGATIIAQTGGFGIEPIVYVLGRDAPAVVEHLLAVLHDESQATDN